MVTVVDGSQPDNGTDINMICYAPGRITTNGVWLGENPFDFSLPIFLLQFALVITTTRAIVYILKPFRQPRVISEILGGIFLGPSVLGQSQKFANLFFPQRSVMVLEIMANIGLLYFIFLVGVEMDISVVRRTGNQAVAIAIGGMILPLLIGCGFSLVISQNNHSDYSLATNVLFLGVSLSVTAFPVLARILAELKIINTEIGRIAMSSALVNDGCAWILLALAIALSENDKTSLSSIYIMLSIAVFMAVCIYVVRPIISWITRKTPDGESFSDFHICLVLTGVPVSGFITDALGTHSALGAFMYGLSIPNGPLGLALIDKLEDFVSGLLLPLFFALSGLKTNISAIKGVFTWIMLLLMVLMACAGKVFGTMVVAMFHNMSIREGVTLGLLLNTKGLIEIIVLNVGKDQKVLDDATFATMVIAAVIITGIITPIVATIYRPEKRFVPYTRRTIQKTKLDNGLRILVCIHTPRNVPTIINLLEASQPMRRSTISIYVLHLVELTGRASAMLIVHNTSKSGSTPGQSNHIFNAFENYEQHASYVTVQPLTAISPYSTMHEDVCNLAEDKRAAFIIIPFHKQQAVDGGMETANPAYQLVNQNLLETAPCSVGILVDRGLKEVSRLASSTMTLKVAVLMFGGPDDREALAYAWRMSEHEGITLKVMRFIPGDAVPPGSTRAADLGSQKKIKVQLDQEYQRKLDEEYIHAFRVANMDHEGIVYEEKVVNDGEDTVAAVRSMDSSHDLFIVGRGQGMSNPLTAGLTDWSECPELGAIGDLLASSDFAATVSVLVVQQYVGPLTQEEETDLLDSPQKSHQHISLETHAQLKSVHIPTSPKQIKLID